LLVRKSAEGGTQPGGSLFDVSQVLLFLLCRKRAGVGKLSNWITRIRHEIASAGVDDVGANCDAGKNEIRPELVIG
jgi:hypothetical protein